MVHTVVPTVVPAVVPAVVAMPSLPRLVAEPPHKPCVLLPRPAHDMCDVIISPGGGCPLADM